MKWIIAVVSGIAMLLGAFALVQGLGIIAYPAVLPIEGVSIGWAIAGAVVLLAGTFVLWATVLRGRAAH